MSKKIIWCGNSYYGSPFKVGCNYYSEILSKQGNKVLFISPPVSPFHNRKENRVRFEQARKGIVEVFDNYFVYTPYTILPPVKRLPLWLSCITNNWHRFTIPNLSKVIREVGFEDVDILVIDYFSFLPLVSFIKYEKLIVRVTDNLSGFNVGGAALKAEKLLIKMADKVVVTSHRLINYAKSFNSNVIYVSNGVDFNKFQGRFKKPEIFSKINEPVAIYIGAIDVWFDFDLLEYVSNILKNVHFLIVGPVKNTSKNFNRLKGKRNVTFLGGIDNSLVPNYLFYASVGIIPFRKDMPLVQTVSPLKLYEYMACGLPVVSSEWEEIRNVDSPAYLCKTEGEFVKNIKRALKDKNKEKYINFARKNDWKEKLKLLLSE